MFSHSQSHKHGLASGQIFHKCHTASTPYSRINHLNTYTAHFASTQIHDLWLLHVWKPPPWLHSKPHPTVISSMAFWTPFSFCNISCCLCFVMQDHMKSISTIIKNDPVLISTQGRLDFLSVLKFLSCECAAYYTEVHQGHEQQLAWKPSECLSCSVCG